MSIANVAERAWFRTLQQVAACKPGTPEHRLWSLHEAGCFRAVLREREENALLGSLVQRLRPALGSTQQAAS